MDGWMGTLNFTLRFCFKFQDYTNKRRSTMSNTQTSWQVSGADRGGILPRSMMAQMAGAENQQSGMSISPGSSHVTVGELEPWMVGVYDTPLLPSFASHYMIGDGVSGRRSTLRCFIHLALLLTLKGKKKESDCRDVVSAKW